MKSFFFTIVFLTLSLFCSGAIYNLTEITELSDPNLVESHPYIMDDELTIYCLCWSDPNLMYFVEASRATKSDPFSNITTAPFTNVNGILGYPWVSEDKLRLYFHHASLYESYDLMETSRTLTTIPFNPPVKMPNISQEHITDQRPRLANNELTIYFQSNRDYPTSSRIYRSTRLDINSDFPPPVLVSEITSEYLLLDITNDDWEQYK